MGRQGAGDRKQQDRREGTSEHDGQGRGARRYRCAELRRRYSPIRADDAPNDVGRTIQRIATGVRLVGLAWMGILAAVTVVRHDLTRPGVGWLLISLAVLWGVISGLAADLSLRTEPGWLTVGDASLAIFGLFAPKLAGSEQLFYGGFPAIAVAVAAAQSRTRGWLVATIMSGAVVVRLGVASFADLVGSLSQLVAYSMIALIVGWAVHLIYLSDSARRRAEAERARAEERAEVAAHLHDSVLQTLALIQRSPADSVRVGTLARYQERELRRWLYGSASPDGESVASALQMAAGEVESLHGIHVELVTVGDAPLTVAREALVAAGREAMVNAAKHAGVESVSVYLEVGAQTTLFVRDRGAGFDPTAVGGEHHGLRDSIEGRLARVGGSAVVRSSPGAGTEVKMEVAG